MIALPRRTEHYSDWLAYLHIRVRSAMLRVGRRFMAYTHVLICVGGGTTPKAAAMEQMCICERISECVCITATSSNIFVRCLSKWNNLMRNLCSEFCWLTLLRIHSSWSHTSVGSRPTSTSPSSRKSTRVRVRFYMIATDAIFYIISVSMMHTASHTRNVYVIRTRLHYKKELVAFKVRGNVFAHPSRTQTHHKQSAAATTQRAYHRCVCWFARKRFMMRDRRERRARPKWSGWWSPTMVIWMMADVDGFSWISRETTKSSRWK